MVDYFCFSLLFDGNLAPHSCLHMLSRANAHTPMPHIVWHCATTAMVMSIDTFQMLPHDDIHRMPPLHVATAPLSNVHKHLPAETATTLTLGHSDMNNNLAAATAPCGDRPTMSCQSHTSCIMVYCLLPPLEQPCWIPATTTTTVNAMTNKTCNSTLCQ